jgi:DNA-directed RNA polymerase specialized sigma24 family protein
MTLDYRRRRFPTTRWSVVVAAGDSVSPESQAALSALCEAYWAPVYAYVCQTGRPADVARDLTQAFFARVLQKRDFRNARSDLGRFRTFLLTAVRYFLSNQVDYERTAKRGGGQVHLPIDPVPGGKQKPSASAPIRRSRVLKRTSTTIISTLRIARSN